MNVEQGISNVELFLALKSFFLDSISSFGLLALCAMRYALCAMPSAPYVNISRNFFSLSIVIPISVAFSNLEPGDSPAIR
jgi:hypothetical protein